MKLDLTVASIPVYFATMAAERRWLRRRAEQRGPSAADYTREDALASLAMGVGSLLVPLATARVTKATSPGSGRLGKALVGTAAAAAVATTVADRVVAATDDPGDPVELREADARTPRPEPAPRRRSVRRWAAKVARAGGVTTVFAGGLALASWAATRTAPQRMWEKGKRHDLGAGPLAWLLATFGWDFIYYWNHRFMHESRALWAVHVVHHSSEHYNLSTALRQPVADVLNVSVPYGLLCRIGVRPDLIVQARALNLLYQYWIHTEAIDRLPARAEAVLNTPSHHRVHHGSQTKYIDRNHGSILITWDKLFGTFQPEEERVEYGLTKNIDTYNPARIATHEYTDIARDVAGSTTWRDRLSFVLRGPGWAYERHAARAEVTGRQPAALPTAAA